MLLVLNLFGDQTQSLFDNMIVYLNVKPETQKTGAIEMVTGSSKTCPTVRRQI